MRPPADGSGDLMATVTARLQPLIALRHRLDAWNARAACGLPVPAISEAELAELLALRELLALAADELDVVAAECGGRQVPGPPPADN